LKAEEERAGIRMTQRRRVNRDSQRRRRKEFYTEGTETKRARRYKNSLPLLD
jgi:hypothetical protein